MTHPPPLNFIAIDRYWFLTWTTYGSWLPGDERGYVGFAPDEFGRIVNYNRPHTPPAPPNPALKRAAERSLKSAPILLNRDQAAALLDQFLETTTHRQWLLSAAAIMTTHIHALVGVPGDPDPEKIRDDLKSWGSRCLNNLCGRPPGGAWWTALGSVRKVEYECVPQVVLYIRDQPNPLLIWTRDDGQIV